jgi:hypothetical protein
MSTSIYKLVKHLASLLGPHLGNFLYHVRNSEDFGHTMDPLWINLMDTISFHVILLTLHQDAEQGCLESWLFHHIHTSSFFCFSVLFHRQGCHGLTAVTCDCQLLQSTGPSAGSITFVTLMDQKTERLP